MSTCPKRSVLGAGDRPARIRAAAAAVQQAARKIKPRVLPHAGRHGSPTGNGLGRTGSAGAYVPGRQMPVGRPITRGALGGGAGPSGSGFDDPLINMIEELSRAVDNFAREVSDQFDAIDAHERERAASGESDLRLFVRVHIGPYVEPMLLPATPADFAPIIIFAGRIVNMAEATTPVLTGALVHWSPVAQGRFAMQSIDGMTTNDGNTYAITYLFIGN